MFAERGLSARVVLTDGAQADTEHLGRLREGQALVEGQMQDLTLSFGESFQSAPQVAVNLFLFEPFQSARVFVDGLDLVASEEAGAPPGLAGACDVLRWRRA